MKKAKSKAWADFIWNKERGYINLHTRAYLLCPATRQGNQLPREFVNRRSQRIQDYVSIKAPVKSYTVEKQRISWTSGHFDGICRRWSRKVLMQISRDWKVNGPDKDKITIWWRENTKPREKMCGISILTSRHYNSPITYKLKLSGFMSEWKSHLVALGNLAMEGIYHQSNQISSSVFSYY